MAKFNRFNSVIGLIGLLGIFTAVGTAAYNYIQYQLLLTRSENLRTERKRAEKELDILPDFDRLYPTITDYKKPIFKVVTRKPRTGETQPPDTRTLVTCSKCQKPLMVPEGATRATCPHCGASWSLE